MKRVLVIFPGALGDLICLGPSLWALRRRYPDQSLELMAREELARLAVGRLGIDRALSIDRREVSALFVAGSAADPLFAGYQRILCFFAADHPVFRASLRAAAPEANISFHPFRPLRAGHVAEAYLESLGLNPGPLEARFRVLDADLEAADRELDRLGLRVGNLMLLFPGSGAPAKNWRLENFLALAARMRPRLAPLAVLGPAEMDFGERIAAAGIATLSGLELATVAALAVRARLFVGNDSGVSHLAAAAGAPGVVIFGPSDPGRFRPLGEVRIVASDPLERLSVAEVAAAVEARLNRAAERDVKPGMEAAVHHARK